MAVGERPSKTQLRQGLIEQIRRPSTVVLPLSTQELHCLGHDPEDDRRPIGLHDSPDPVDD